MHTYPMWRENILSTRGNFFVPSGRKVAITTRQWQGKNVVVGANSYGNLRLYQGVPKRSDKYNDSDDVSLWRSAPDVKVVGHPEELWYHGGIGFIGATLSCGEYGDTRVYVALMWDTETPLL